MTGPGTTAYPWERLARVARRDARAARRIRTAVHRILDPPALASALSEVLASDVAIRVRSIAPHAAATDAEPVVLESATGSLRVVVDPETPLVLAALGRLLGRDLGVPDGARPLDEALTGAVAALAVEVARRAAAAVPLRASPRARGAPEPIPGPSLEVTATVVLDGRPYDLVLRIRAVAAPDPADAARSLGRLGDLPLTLPVVGALGTSSAAEFHALAPGDVFLPGEGWLIEPASVAARSAAALTEVVLGSPGGERGVRARRSEDGKFVLRPGTVALAQDARAEGHPGMSGPDDTLREIALDAPVVVRVEVATVTLSAGEWADIGPGDVIETGLRVGEHVVLRVAGREVARGDLVSVDGELGVQIRELVSPAR